MKEEWRTIADFPDYEVSNHGRVRSYKTHRPGEARASEPHLLKPLFTGSGRHGLCVVLAKQQKRTWRTIASLVADAFLTPQPKDTRITYHKDNDPTNNRVDNLSHVCTHLRILRKFNSDQIVEIREKRVAGSSLINLAEEYEAGIVTICHLFLGKIYPEVPGPISKPYEIHVNI